MVATKKTKKPVSKKILTKKTTSKKDIKKTLTKTLLANQNLIKGTLGVLGTTLLGYGVYKGYQYAKIVTKQKSISNLFNNKEDVVNFLYDPKYKGEWKGDAGIASLFFREYLLTKNKNACTFDKEILVLRFGINFLNLNVVKIKIINNKRSIILDTLSIDEIPEFFKNLLNNCKTEFVVIPIAFTTESLIPNIGHANVLIYNRNKNIIEHYEPYGSNAFTNDHDDYYKKLKKIFNEINIVYCNPANTCPLVGPQKRENLCPNIVFNVKTLGFCLIWSMWLAELRINNPNVNSKQLIENEIKKIQGNNVGNICIFIVSYAQFILEFSKKYDLIIDKETGITIDYTKKL
jgi:hypothetical protein